jgi:DNA-binding transcriptional regulator YiaG
MALAGSPLTMSTAVDDCPLAMRALTTTQTRTLHRACELAGGVEQLAAALEVPARTLARWMKGEEKTPQRVFLSAVDLILAAPPQPAGLT